MPRLVVRRQDFNGMDRPWQEHPDATFQRPTSWGPERFWIYQVLASGRRDWNDARLLYRSSLEACHMRTVHDMQLLATIICEAVCVLLWTPV